MAAISLFWGTGEAAVTSCENTLKRMYINLFSRAGVHQWQLFLPNRQGPLSSMLYLRLKKQVKLSRHGRLRTF